MTTEPPPDQALPVEPSPPEPAAPDAGPPPDEPLPGGPEQAAPPDTTVTEPEPGQPYPPEEPPPGPLPGATENENPVLPHSAQAGAARAVAAFSVVIDLGTNPDDPAAALAKILALMQQMLADVGRFVPPAMQQTAADQVQAVADQLPQ